VNEFCGGIKFLFIEVCFFLFVERFERIGVKQFESLIEPRGVGGA
jgi:hypothetical protein